MVDWIIFDADNTLWELEPLYDSARDEMSDLIARISGAAEKEVEAFQRNKDAELYEHHGYHPRRFPISFVETAKHFLPNKAYREHNQKVRALAERVFEADAMPVEGIGEVLAELAMHANLGVITSGHEDIQRRKLSSFPHIDIFSEQIKIVREKTAETILEFCHDYKVEISESWMIGDSLRSDILPARQVGLNAVHLSIPNWHEVETSGHLLPVGVHQVSNIREVPSVILSIAPS